MPIKALAKKFCLPFQMNLFGRTFLPKLGSWRFFMEMPSSAFCLDNKGIRYSASILVYSAKNDSRSCKHIRAFATAGPGPAVLVKSYCLGHIPFGRIREIGAQIILQDVLPILFRVGKQIRCGLEFVAITLS
jgi:hypothetical protein